MYFYIVVAEYMALIYFIMEKLIGRETEKEILNSALQSDEPELIAVYGRRRVGKTFLIRQVFKSNLIFEFSGVHHAPANEQLRNFRDTLANNISFKISLAVPENWTEAFKMLINFATPLLKKQKVVIFFDEFPWLSSAKSGFMSAFEYFWNSWGTKQPNLIVTICGSAASWMIQKVVNNKGGLHNRITKRIRLIPFTLRETAAYLNSRSILLDQYQILQIYMAFGGIPQYLKEIKKGESAAQAIDRVCFTKDGLLQNEFDNLYYSLFDTADKHISIVKALASKASGLTRKDIILACSLSSGGTTTKILDELIESGFVSAYVPFEKNSRDIIYKLSDEFSRFYLKFIDNSRAGGQGTWVKLSVSPSWKSWSGTAFESICLKHSKEIKVALGISGVYTEESAWRSIGNENMKGAQVDLLLDRQDFCISICEMKFSNTVFTIDKTYALALQNKLDVFKEQTKSKKTLFLTMVTAFGLKDNIYKSGLVQNEITMSDLFV